MPAAVARRNNPQTAGGNTTQREATGWKREKKKRKQPVKGKVPPFPDLRKYQPVPLCSSLTRVRPVWYAFHQVEQQIAQYAAQILLQQQQQHVEQPQKKRQPSQRAGRKQQKPQTTDRQQQARRDQRRQQSPNGGGEEVQQHLQRQIEILLNQHEQFLFLQQQQQQKHTVNAPREVACAAASSGSIAVSDASRTQLLGSNTAAAVTAETAACYTSGTQQDSTAKWKTSTNGLKNDGLAMWDTSTCPTSGGAGAAASSTTETKAAAWMQHEEPNGIESQQEQHAVCVERTTGVTRQQQEDVSQGTYHSSAAAYNGSSGTYPSENFVMVVRRRPRELRPPAATEGAAAAPRPPTTATKGPAALRRGKKPAGRTSAEKKGMGRALPTRAAAKVASPRKKTSPGQQHSPATTSSAVLHTATDLPSAAAPGSTEMHATFITHDERFVEMESALNRYWKVMGRRTLTDEILFKEPSAPGARVASGEATAGKVTQAAPSPAAPREGVDGGGGTGVATATAAAASGGTYVSEAAQRYFKTNIAKPPQRRVEARWVRKEVGGAVNASEEASSPPTAAADAYTGSNGRACETADDACVRFSENAWGCLTGTAEAAAAAESAHAFAAAVAAEMEAPARELARQKVHAFYNDLAACLRELLVSRDRHFRLAHLDTVYRWFCTKHPRLSGRHLCGQKELLRSRAPRPYATTAAATCIPLPSHVASTASASSSSASFPVDAAPAVAASTGPSSLACMSHSSWLQFAAPSDSAARGASPSRLSATAAGSGGEATEDFDTLFEASTEQPPPRFPLLKEAAAFDARQLSQCSGSAFLGCTYTRKGKTIHPSCSRKRLSMDGRLDSTDSTDTVVNAAECRAVDSSSPDRRCSARQTIPHRPSTTTAAQLQGRSRGSLLADENSGKKQSFSSRGTSSNENKGVTTLQSSLTAGSSPSPAAVPDTNADGPAVRGCPTGFRRPTTAIAAIRPAASAKLLGDAAAALAAAADAVANADRYDRGAAVTPATHAEMHFKDKEQGPAHAGAAAEPSTNTETCFLDVVQQHAPLITPMDRLREYRTRTLIHPEAGAALQQQLQVPRLKSTAFLPLFSSAGLAAGAGGAPLVASSPKAGLRSVLGQGRATVDDPHAAATRNTSGAPAALGTGSVSAGAPSGRNVSPRLTMKTVVGSATPLLQAGQLLQQQQRHRSWQQLDPLRPEELLPDGLSLGTATAPDQAATLCRTDSAEEAEAAINDLRYDYLRDWRREQQPWGMQAPDSPRNAAAAATAAGRNKATFGAAAQRRSTTANSQFEGNSHVEDFETAAALAL